MRFSKLTEIFTHIQIEGGGEGGGWEEFKTRSLKIDVFRRL